MGVKTNLGQFIKKRLVQILLWLVTAVFALLVLTILLIQLPNVQTYIVTKVTSRLSELTNHKITIDYINISWFDEVYLEGVALYDTRDSLMYGAKEMTFDLDMIEMVKTKRIELDRIEIKSGTIHLIKHIEELPLNLTMFLDEVRALSGSESSAKEKKPIRVDEIDVWNTTFRMDDFRVPEQETGIDPSHLNIQDINLSLHDFRLIYDSIDFNITSLSAREKTDKLVLRNMNAGFYLTSHKMEFTDLYLETSRSVVKDYVKFGFSSIANLSYFTDSVSFDINLDQSYIHSQDLAQFSSALSQYNQQILIDGRYYGKVNNFQAKSLMLKVGENTLIKGDCFLTGLPNIKETFIEFKFGRSKIDPKDLRFAFPVDSFQSLMELGPINIDGTFLGFPTDFVAEANFETKNGSISTNLNLKLKEDRTKSVYIGTIATENIDLGRIVGYNDIIDNITMNGKISGKGLTPESADFKLNAMIQKFRINNYTYTNISTDGHFKSGFFQGKLGIDDPNVGLKLNGVIDVRKGQEKIEGIADLSHFNALPLGFGTKELSLSTGIDISLEGLSVDDFAGYVRLRDINLALQQDSLYLDSLTVTSLKVAEDRLITVSTKGIQAEVNGNYKTSELIKDIRQLYREYQLELTNDEDAINQYYEQVTYNQRPYDVDISLLIENANDYIQPFTEGIYISENFELSGGFRNDENSNLSLYSVIDTMSIDNIGFKNTVFELNTTKFRVDRNVLAMLYISTEQQHWGPNYVSNDMEFEAVWNEDHMELYFAGSEEKSGTKANIKATVDFLQDTTTVKFLPSFITLYGNPWNFSENNIIQVLDNRIAIRQFELFTSGQSFKIDGMLSDSSDLRIDISDVELHPLSFLINQELFGISNGHLELHGPITDLFATGKFEIDSLLLDQLHVGDLKIDASWNDVAKKLNVNTGVSRDQVKLVDIHGDILFEEEDKRLDLEATFNDTDIDIIEPFLNEHIANLKGKASGEFKIGGTVQSPEIMGEGEVSGGRVKLNYLNTTYDFSGSYGFNKELIVFDRVELIDANQHNAYFRGTIAHQGFRNMILDVSGDIFEFNVLNTNSSDNSLYYGEVNATGTLNFSGPINNLKIAAKARTDKNSKLFVPLTDNSAADLKDYISFVNLSDTVQTEGNRTIQSETNLSGIELDLELEVTEEAYFELIFDLKAGDIIRGRGNGNLRIQINTEGDFNMVGDYMLTQGGYNFTLYNIINKEFDIVKGSKISWYGDPYKAILDITANYRQNVPYEPILTGLSDEARNDPQVSRRYPVIVVLKLTDEMLNPTIDFDIEFEGYPQQSITLGDGTSLNYGAYVDPFKFKINSNEQELKRQVFSLLILRRLSPENSFEVAGQSIGNSVSEFISNQLSYWISQVDENLEIDVDLATLDQDAFETFQLRLSYTFLNGRLRVSRMGGIATSTPSATSTNTQSANFTNIIGDISVEYLLTQDGRLRAKMYSRSQEDIDVEQALETGVSLQYVRTFDYIQEIWRKNRSKKTRFVDADGNVVETIGDNKKEKKKSEK